MPEKVRYADIRDILQRLLDNLTKAEGTLAAD